MTKPLNVDRRTVLRTAGLATLAALAGCAGSSSGGGATDTPNAGDGDSGGESSSGGGGSDGTAAPAPATATTDSSGSSSSDSSSSSSVSFDGWFEGVSNFDGSVVDATGQSEVEVTVGAGGNGGNLAFDPPAVRVSQGTTVVWTWTGMGGTHNVAAEDGSFESELVTEEGHTFSHAFEESGTVEYVCTPHRALGMKGAVVVE
ncbi:halocyanin domain-containing protein [Salinigranum sp. GCM10025319]|uniref:halocyanin domain-containing protein n=1 Tax=Salinigranum sp. GCM10025319 TaxID=3252687 RepID=UPI00361EC515